MSCPYGGRLGIVRRSCLLGRWRGVPIRPCRVALDLGSIDFPVAVHTMPAVDMTPIHPANSHSLVFPLHAPSLRDGLVPQAAASDEAKITDTMNWNV